MKRIGVVVTSIALAMAPALAADKTIPLAAMTCKQFVDSPKDTIGVILTWMMGYLQDEDEPAELDFSKMEDLGKKLGTYCGQNPTGERRRRRFQGAEIRRRSVDLRGQAGLDRGPARWFSHAMSHRSGRIGVLFEGGFRAPNILAWEKIWGDDQVVREKDAIKLTGKFGSFSYKRDDSDRPPARCAAT